MLLAACARGRLVRDGQVDRDGLAAVERSIATIRGRALRTPVPAVLLDPAGLRAMIASEIDAGYAPGDIEHIEAVYIQLGLLPPGTRLKSSVEGLYEAEGAAFYDPRAKRLVISTTPIETPLMVRMVGFLTGRDLAGEMIVAHELVHAMQDQYWGVPTAPDPVANAQGDCHLARRALLEGDATLAGFGQIMGGGPDPDAARAIERELTKLPAELAARHPDVPPALLATLTVQYQAGTAFVARALAAGGWPPWMRCTTIRRRRRSRCSTPHATSTRATCPWRSRSVGPTRSLPPAGRRCSRIPSARSSSASWPSGLSPATARPPSPRAGAATACARSPVAASWSSYG
jgi:hypothetical protein